MPDRMPEDMPEDMSDRMPEDMPDRMPDYLPDRMPEDMPEHMPDRMPEDLPVRKCINVMVGITRSKVFFLGCLGKDFKISGSVPSRTRTATCGSKCSPPDLHRKLRIKLFLPAGLQPRAPDQSVSRRTSTTKNLRRYTR